MSYAAIITTQKTAVNYVNDLVDLENINKLTNKIIGIKDNEYGYLIVLKKSFAPPYYPAKKKKSWKDKIGFKNALKDIDNRYLIKKLLFVFLGEDESFHSTQLCDLNEIFENIDNDSIKANVLYKIKHNYTEYMK